MTTLEGHYEVEMQIRREKMPFSFDRLLAIEVLVNEIDNGVIEYTNRYFFKIGTTVAIFCSPIECKG